MSGGLGIITRRHLPEGEKDKLLRLFVFLFLFESFEFDSFFLLRVFVLGRV
jgi:hypothetical protein